MGFLEGNSTSNDQGEDASAFSSSLTTRSPAPSNSRSTFSPALSFLLMWFESPTSTTADECQPSSCLRKASVLLLPDQVARNRHQHPCWAAL